MPRIWTFYLALIGLALVRRDMVALRVSVALLLDWCSADLLFLLTGEQYNALANFTIDYVFFGVVVAESIVGLVSRGNALLHGNSPPRVAVLNGMQRVVGALFFFLCVCHALAAISIAEGRFDAAFVYRYWHQMHDAAWAQVWAVAFFGSGGGNVLRVVGDRLRGRWRHAGHAVVAGALGIYSSWQGGRVDGELVGVGRNGGHGDRGGDAVGRDHWSRLADGVTGDFRFGRDHLLAAAHDLRLDEADDLYGGREWQRISLNSVFSDRLGGSGKGERKQAAISRNDVRAPGGYDGRRAADDGHTFMKDAFLGARAILVAAFRVPASSERNRAVDHVIAQAAEVEKAAQQVQALFEDEGDPASLDDAVRRIAEDL